MIIKLPVAAAITIVVLTAPLAHAQERATPSPMNLGQRFTEQPPLTVRGDVSEPLWVIAPSPQWPDNARDIAEKVTVTSECAVSNSGGMRNCRIVHESVPARGFGRSFLRALAKAKVETSAFRSEAGAFRTTATFHPPGTY